MTKAEATPDLVAQLVAARDTRTPLALPEAFGGDLSPVQAYELQKLHVDAMLSRYGGSVIGTKLGGGTMAAMAGFGLTGPFRGPIFSTFTRDSPARFARSDSFQCIVEAEVALVMGEDLGRTTVPPSHDELTRAVVAAIPSIETADARYTVFDKRPPAAIIADLSYAGAWVRGAAVEDWRRIDWPALQVRLLSDGREVRSGGTLSLGTPFDALGLLAADLGRMGQNLRAGQVVSTGTYTTPYLARAGEVLVANFGDLGKVQVTLF